MTGILDRLERGGWVIGERDPSDRRGSSFGRSIAEMPNWCASTPG
jgi:hypothetical protein